MSGSFKESLRNSFYQTILTTALVLELESLPDQILTHPTTQKLSSDQQVQYIFDLASRTLFYESLNGNVSAKPGHPFFDNMHDYVQANGLRMPCAINFTARTSQGERSFTLALCDAFVNDAYAMATSEAIACVPQSAQKDAAFSNLFDHFVQGREAANRDLIQFMDGATNNCGQFLTDHPRNPHPTFYPGWHIGPRG